MPELTCPNKPGKIESLTRWSEVAVGPKFAVTTLPFANNYQLRLSYLPTGDADGVHMRAMAYLIQTKDERGPCNKIRCQSCSSDIMTLPEARKWAVESIKGRLLEIADNTRLIIDAMTSGHGYSDAMTMSLPSCGKEAGRDDDAAD